MNILTSRWVALAMLAFAAQGAAQFRNSPTPPRVPRQPPRSSSYLNLLQPNTDLGVQYLGIIRPQAQAGNAFASQQAQIQQMAAEARARDTEVNQQLSDQLRQLEEFRTPDSRRAVTGHRVSYFNTGRYFPGRK